MSLIYAIFSMHGTRKKWLSSFASFCCVFVLKEGIASFKNVWKSLCFDESGRNAAMVKCFIFCTRMRMEKQLANATSQCHSALPTVSNNLWNITPKFRATNSLSHAEKPSDFFLWIEDDGSANLRKDVENCSAATNFYRRTLQTSWETKTFRVLAFLFYCPASNKFFLFPQIEFDEKELRREITYAIKNIHGIRYVQMQIPLFEKLPKRKKAKLQKTVVNWTRN